MSTDERDHRRVDPPAPDTDSGETVAEPPDPTVEAPEPQDEAGVGAVGGLVAGAAAGAAVGGPVGAVLGGGLGAAVGAQAGQAVGESRDDENKDEGGVDTAREGDRRKRSESSNR